MRLGIGHALSRSQAIASGPSWLPSSSANLKLWLDATVGFTAAQWSDQSGGSHHFTQAVPSSRPAIASAAINGRDAVRFTGASSNSMAGPAWSNLITNNAYTILIVAQPITIADTSATSYLNTPILADTGGYCGAYVDSTGPKAVAGNYVAGDTVVKSALVGLSNTYLHAQRHIGGQLYLSVNSGAEAGPVASGNTGSLLGAPSLALGNSPHYFNGYICEVLVYSVDLDTQAAGDLAKAKAYLKAKWGTP